MRKRKLMYRKGLILLRERKIKGMVVLLDIQFYKQRQ